MVNIGKARRGSFAFVIMSKTGSRFFYGGFATARAKMSTNAGKKSSHYDTLEVNSRATQGEIKSAYFKLSKQYHPDKNSSEAATGKFRDITEAYEVLGNFASRKNYDRGLLVKNRHQARQRTDVKADPNMKFYQEKAAVFRDNQKSGSTPLYDFDAWTKAHYGRTLQRTLYDKMEGRRRRNSRMEYSELEYDHPTDYSIIAIALVSLVAIFLIGVPRHTQEGQEPSSGVKNMVDTTELSVRRSDVDAATKSV